MNLEVQHHVSHAALCVFYQLLTWLVFQVTSATGVGRRAGTFSLINMAFPFPTLKVYSASFKTCGAIRLYKSAVTILEEAK